MNSLFNCQRKQRQDLETNHIYYIKYMFEDENVNMLRYNYTNYNDEKINFLYSEYIYGISFNSNSLTKIPCCIQKLLNLKYLNCGFNKLTHLPDFVCSLNKLIDLECNNNNIKYLPKNIGNLILLKR